MNKKVLFTIKKNFLQNRYFLQKSSSPKEIYFQKKRPLQQKPIHFHLYAKKTSPYANNIPSYWITNIFKIC